MGTPLSRGGEVLGKGNSLSGNLFEVSSRTQALYLHHQHSGKVYQGGEKEKQSDRGIS